MNRWLPGFGVPVLGLLLLPSVACDTSTIATSATAPAAVTAAGGTQVSFGLEPSTLRPEALPDRCGTHGAFGLRLGLRVRGGDDLILTGLRFFYIDRGGSRRFPEVIPIPDLSATGYPFGGIPASSTVSTPGVAPLPTATPIPLPGSPASVTGLLIRPGSHPRLDYFLRFGCVPIGRGVIVGEIESADRDGTRRSTEVRAGVDG